MRLLFLGDLRATHAAASRDFLLLRAWGTARSGDEARLLIRLDELTRVDADTSYLRALATLRARAEPSSSTA